MLTRLLIVVSLTGCASDDYARYTDTQAAIQVAKFNAEAEKYKAMSAIAASGDTTAKVAAVMAMQSSGSGNQQSFITPPKTGWEIARDFAGILVPAIVQGYSIGANKAIATTMSNNSRDVSMSTNSAFTSMAGSIQAPQANQTINGNGTIGNGAYSTSANQSVGGSGVVGTGTYSPVTDSQNPTTSTTTTTTTTTDNHAVSTDNHAVSTTTNCNVAPC